MEGSMWILAGLALIAIIALRLRSEHPAPGAEGFAGIDGGFRCEHKGVFDVKIIALEFDETGPVVYVNGEFRAGTEPMDIATVAAEADMSGEKEAFVAFDPDADEVFGGKKVGDLINLTTPVTLGPHERGMFRAPLFSPEREEFIGDIMEKLDSAAARMVEKFDREFDDYLFEGESLERLERDFKRDFVVKEIIEQIERKLFWKSGRLSLAVSFFSNGNETLEKIDISLSLRREDEEKLRENIGVIATNSLRAELDMDPEPYNSVVYERS